MDAQFFRLANLSIDPIPHPDSSFDSISAFDFLEHVPRCSRPLTVAARGCPSSN